MKKEEWIEQYKDKADFDYSALWDGLTDFKRFQNYQQYENKAWYSGNATLIRAFYQKNYGNIGGLPYAENFFWRKVCGDVSMVHVPVPSSISETMSTVLFGRMPQIKADTTNKSNNAKIDKRVQTIFDYNNLAQCLQTASQLESYSGAVAAKITIDADFKHPILQWYSAEDVRVHTKYGRVCEVEFRDKYYTKQDAFVLKTFCGRGYIRYELCRADGIGYTANYQDGEKVSLSECPETANLKDIDFVDEEGNPIDLMMCVFKQNLVANNTITKSSIGSADYEGLQSVFDSIDETASAMVDVIKKSRTYTFIPERMLAKDEFGNVAVNRAYGLDVWDVNKVAEQNEKLPSRDYVAISITPYIEALKELVRVCLNRVGLSPATFGMDDAGANASAEALNIRDAKTEKTYKNKSELWKPALEQLARLLLIFDDIKTTKENKNGAFVVKRALVEMPFAVTFPPYHEMTAQQKFSQWIEMIENGAMSVEYAMNDALNEEIPDADIEQIKTQLGLMTAQETEQPQPAPDENITNPDKD